MQKFSVPLPIIDKKEEELIEKLTEDYKIFISPGKVSKSLQKLRDGIVKITPDKLIKLATTAIDTATEWEFIKAALEHAGRGFTELSKHIANLTLSQKSIITILNNYNFECYLEHFDQICAKRSYHIEPVVTKRNNIDRFAAFVEGLTTGAPGLPGLPFNIALSFLLYFRAAQSIALYYGYDIKGDPRELEIASQVTFGSLTSNVDKGINTLNGFIGKMMMATNVTVLRQSLTKRTYEEMAKRGGSELLYVQIRSLANKAAEKALKNAGKEGIEAGIFRKLLEQIGKKMPKEASKKAIPVLGAIIGGLSDTYYMSRVLYGANLIYHKRFLFEKEHRVNIL